MKVNVVRKSTILYSEPLNVVNPRFAGGTPYTVNISEGIVDYIRKKYMG
jgi:hypothetical protein